MVISERKKIRNAAFTVLEFAAALAGLSLMTTYAADAAFTLVELCIVLVVITLLGSMVLGKMSQDTRVAKTVRIQGKLDKIEQALISFSSINGRLPVPADGSQPRDTSSTFGVEVAAPTGFFTNALGRADAGQTQYLGVLPVRTLAPYGLTDADILDPYGNELAYVVSAKATVATAFSIYTQSQLAAITVDDASGATRTTTAIELVFTYGVSGHGAYQINGVRKVANITNPDMLMNCQCDVNGNPVAGAFVFTLHSSNQTTSNNPATLFDDIGRFRSPEFFVEKSNNVSVPDSPPARIADPQPDSPPVIPPTPTPTTPATPTPTTPATPTATPTPMPTPTPTSTPTATPTPMPTPTPADCQVAGNVIANCGFEADGGSLTSWTSSTFLIDDSPVYSGGYAASTTVPKYGDSTIYQRITVPSGSPVLAFWYYTVGVCGPESSCPYFTINFGPNGSALDTPLMWYYVGSGNDNRWIHGGFSMSSYASQTNKLSVNVHGGGADASSNVYLDDFSLTR